MTAQIAGKLSRAELGLRAPRSRSLNIRPDQGGSTLHWGGPGSVIRSHETCKEVWRGWQDFHMGPERGWVDIAYTMGFCQHGYAFAGRGYGVRTAAQGTNLGNDVSYAFCHINEEGHPPTPAALSAAAWLIEDARRNGGAGLRAWAHWDWHQTDCPGTVLAETAHAVSGRAVHITMALTPEEEIMPTVQEIQQGLLYYPLDKKHVNPLTMISRTYDLVQELAERLAALEERLPAPGAPGASSGGKAGS